MFKSKLISYLTFLLSIIFFFFLPLGIPIVIILNYVLRVSVNRLARLLGSKELGKMVTTRGTIYAMDNLTKPKCNVVGIFTFEDDFQIDRLREIFEKNVLNATLPNGEIKYPELKQYLTKWGGYFFWKDDASFDLNEHVRIHKDKKDPSKDHFKEEDIQELNQELVNKKWIEKKPLWEFIIVNNYHPTFIHSKERDSHTALIIRFHHSLGDGYSWVSILINEMCQREVFKNAKPEYIKRNFSSNLLYCLTFPFKSVYAFAGLILLSLQHFDWIVPNDKQTSQCLIEISEQIPIQTIKDIKNHFGVSFSSVIFAILTGAHREMLLKKGFKPPQILPSFTSLPIPGHPGKLRNHTTGGLIKLPTGEEDPVKRLKLCNKGYENIKRSTLPLFFSWLTMLGGSFLPWITNIVSSQLAVPTIMTILPGGLEFIYGDKENQKHKCIDSMCVAGLFVGNQGILFCILSYGENIRISAIVDTYLMSKDEVKHSVQIIHKEIDLLKQLTI